MSHHCLCDYPAFLRLMMEDVESVELLGGGFGDDWKCWIATRRGNLKSPHAWVSCFPAGVGLMDGFSR